ncbi:MAG: hypothetical protein AB1393_01420 [Candidatus Edwardsbacteria bacterium]
MEKTSLDLLEERVQTTIELVSDLKQQLKKLEQENMELREKIQLREKQSEKYESLEAENLTLKKTKEETIKRLEEILSKLESIEG